MCDLVVGDRVKLTERMAVAFQKRHRGAIDWQKREGAVARITRNKCDIHVRWDGRASIEQLPPKALQKIA